MTILRLIASTAFTFVLGISAAHAWNQGSCTDLNHKVDACYVACAGGVASAYSASARSQGDVCPGYGPGGSSCRDMKNQLERFCQPHKVQGPLTQGVWQPKPQHADPARDAVGKPEKSATIKCKDCLPDSSTKSKAIGTGSSFDKRSASTKTDSVSRMKTQSQDSGGSSRTGSAAVRSEMRDRSTGASSGGPSGGLSAGSSSNRPK